MFDDLRSQVNTPFDDEEPEAAPKPTARAVKAKPVAGRLPTTAASAPAQADRKSVV